MLSSSIKAKLLFLKKALSLPTNIQLYPQNTILRIPYHTIPYTTSILWQTQTKHTSRPFLNSLLSSQPFTPQSRTTSVLTVHHSVLSFSELLKIFLPRQITYTHQPHRHTMPLAPRKQCIWLLLNRGTMLFCFLSLIRLPILQLHLMVSIIEIFCQIFSSNRISVKFTYATTHISKPFISIAISTTQMHYDLFLFCWWTLKLWLLVCLSFFFMHIFLIHCWQPKFFKCKM